MESGHTGRNSGSIGNLSGVTIRNRGQGSAVDLSWTDEPVSGLANANVTGSQGDALAASVPWRPRRRCGMR